MGNERNGYIRYEIFSKEGEDPHYPEKIIVYRECVISEDGECSWLKTNDEISLEHLGFQSGGISESNNISHAPRTGYGFSNG